MCEMERMGKLYDLCGAEIAHLQQNGMDLSNLDDHTVALEAIAGQYEGVSYKEVFYLAMMMVQYRAIYAPAENLSEFDLMAKLLGRMMRDQREEFIRNAHTGVHAT